MALERELKELVMKEVAAQLEEVDYGRVIVELNATSDKVDVVVESRTRFYKRADVIPKPGRVLLAQKRDDDV
jgi:hypothetical protein